MIQILMKLNPQDRPLVSEILSSPIIAKLLLQQETRVNARYFVLLTIRSLLVERLEVDS